MVLNGSSASVLWGRFRKRLNGPTWCSSINSLTKQSSEKPPFSVMVLWVTLDLGTLAAARSESTWQRRAAKRASSSRIKALTSTWKDHSFPLVLVRCFFFSPSPFLLSYPVISRAFRRYYRQQSSVFGWGNTAQLQLDDPASC